MSDRQMEDRFLRIAFVGTRGEVASKVLICRTTGPTD